jgi:hypothetical protein
MSTVALAASCVRKQLPPRYNSLPTPREFEPNSIRAQRRWRDSLAVALMNGMAWKVADSRR